MTQILHVPDFPLNCYIDRLWYTDAPALYSREKILPAPNVDLMINFGEPFQVYAAGANQPTITCSESWWVGLQSRYTVVEFPANTNVLSMNMSHKHLIAQFKRMIGIPPKLLARIYRFQHLLDSINPTKSVDWAELAHQLSYHDQSHFSKDLKAFTGLSPGKYLRQRRQVLEASPEHARYRHHLAIG